MNIGEAARNSGLPAKTIRYYEDIELIRPARRDNGYRHYSDSDLHKLKFLHRARGLGFSVEECRQLLSLYENKNRPSSEVKSLAKKHLADIDHKLAELNSIHEELSRLVRACRGDNRPDCPILEDLAGDSSDK